MKNVYFTKVLLRCLLCLLTGLAGCCINIGGCSQAKYERTDTLVADLEPGSTVIAETSFGSVTVTGGDVTDCRVTAEICVQAPTEEEAAEIAEQVKVRLVGASKFYEFQARRLNMRYKDSTTKKNLFCHTLNNTVIASPRILIPLLELYQNRDGSVTIPKVLRPYMNDKEKITA